MIPFSKYQGTGNDFIVVEQESLGNHRLNAAAVRSLCDRHRGIGADGILLVEPHPSEPSMVVYNADGSRALMCGNGIRCVARHLTRRWSPRETEQWMVQTDAGAHACQVDRDEVEVAMRIPSFDAKEVSAKLEANCLIDADFPVGDATYRVTVVSMGNPHLVLFDIDEAKTGALAQSLSVDPRFTAGVNVGFARTDKAANMLHLRVFERGAGWTEACGTGACAAAAAAVRTQRLDNTKPISVLLPGGKLLITVGEEQEPVLMRGSVRHVFDGMLPTWPASETTGTRRIAP